MRCPCTRQTQKNWRLSASTLPGLHNHAHAAYTTTCMCWQVVASLTGLEGSSVSDEPASGAILRRFTQTLTDCH